MKLATLKALNAARGARRAAALVTDLRSGAQRLVFRDEAADDALAAPLEEAFARDRSGMLDVDGGRFFGNVFNPPPRLAVVGAVHIATFLARLADPLGFDVVVIDPRRAFVEPERLPGARLLRQWPDEALNSLEPDRRTAIVTLSHDPKIDDPALALAVASPAFYIGALGSRRTHARRVERLREAGVDETALARIRGPVGLDIGAGTPQEIALAIMAELVAARRGGPA